MEGAQPVQSYSHTLQPLQPQTCVQEHCPGETRFHSSVFQHFCFTCLPLHPRRRRPSHSLASTLAFVGGGGGGLSFGVRLEGVDPIINFGEETFKKSGSICFKTCQVLLRHDHPPLCFWSGVKTNDTHRTETFDMPSSLWRMFPTRSQEMPTTLAIWLTVKRLSSITMWWTRSMFSWVVAVTGHPDLVSCSTQSLPLLNSAAYSYTVDNAGASSPNVATMSVCRSLAAYPFFLYIW